MSNNTDMGFFEWIVSLFKKEKPVAVVPPTAEELEKEAKWIKIKSMYSLEFLEHHEFYYVRYRFKDQWWYLRRWDDDYTLERVRGNAIQIKDPLYLDNIIRLHQEWINEGHIFFH